jgi:uncharacterized membrane protein
VSGVLIAAVAHAIAGASLVWDKALMGRQRVRSVANYVFWLGALNGLGVLLAVLGFHWPPLRIALLGFGAGLVQLASDFFYYAALRRGEASGTLTIMGGLSPLATALFAAALLGQTLRGGAVVGFALMVGGAFVMCLSDRVEWRRIVLPAIAAGATAGLTNVLQKIVYNGSDFVSGYCFFTAGTAAGAALLLLRPSWRKQIFRETEAAPPRNKAWYFVNRVVAGVGSLLVFFAISKANPAIVDAISGLRYATIFALSLLLTKVRPGWLKEEFTGRALLIKCVGTAAVVAGVVVAGGSGQ